MSRGAKPKPVKAEAQKLGRLSNEQTNELQQSKEDKLADQREAAKERESFDTGTPPSEEAQRRRKVLPGTERD